MVMVWSRETRRQITGSLSAACGASGAGRCVQAGSIRAASETNANRLFMAVLLPPSSARMGFGSTIILGRLGESERQLLAKNVAHMRGPQPGARLELLGEDQSFGDALVAREKFAHQVGAVALAAAVQEDDVLGEPAACFFGAVEDTDDGVEGLLI